MRRALTFCADRSRVTVPIHRLAAQRTRKRFEILRCPPSHPLPLEAGAADTIHTGSSIIFFLYHPFLLLADPLLPIPAFPDRVPPAPPI